MFDYIILDAETRMPVPMQDTYFLSTDGGLCYVDYDADAEIRDCRKAGNYIIQFRVNGKTEEVRY